MIVDGCPVREADRQGLSAFLRRYVVEVPVEFEIPFTAMAVEASYPDVVAAQTRLAIERAKAAGGSVDSFCVNLSPNATKEEFDSLVEWVDRAMSRRGFGGVEKRGSGTTPAAPSSRSLPPSFTWRVAALAFAVGVALMWLALYASARSCGAAHP